MKYLAIFLFSCNVIFTFEVDPELEHHVIQIRKELLKRGVTVKKFSIGFSSNVPAYAMRISNTILVNDSTHWEMSLRSQELNILHEVIHLHGIKSHFEFSVTYRAIFETDLGYNSIYDQAAELILNPHLN